MALSEDARLPAIVFARKLQVQPEWFLVGHVDERLVASVMAGYDGHRGWINYLAVDPDYRRHGYGRAMMAEAEQSATEVSVRFAPSRDPLRVSLEYDRGRLRNDRTRVVRLSSGGVPSAPIVR